MLGGDAPVENAKIQGVPVASARVDGREVRLSLEAVTTREIEARLDVLGLFRLGCYDAEKTLTDLREQEVHLVAVQGGTDVTVPASGPAGLAEAARAWRDDLVARLHELVDDAEDPAEIFEALMPHDVVWCDSEALAVLAELGSD